MIPRYSHPEVERLWSPAATYEMWLEIETEVLAAQRHVGLVPAPPTAPLVYRLRNKDNANHPLIDDPAVEDIQALERRTKHDVVAFLEWLRHEVGEDGQWIHFGLTSSDLVDTAQAMRFRAMHTVLLAEMGNLVSALCRWALDDTPLVGRTHGQPAEPTSMGVRAHHWLATVQNPITAVSAATRSMQKMKLSGPVGTFAHNPPEIEQLVAKELRLTPMGAGASQIIPRSALALWASAAGALAAACAKIALDLRLMNMLEEVRWEQTEGQVGSSAMAHKNNPIVAEQVCGLARLAQGYASALQPMDGWLERDIAHSCVERVAVPDLWHVLLRTLQQTTRMLNDLVVDGAIADQHLADYPEAWVHVNTLEEIKRGTSLDEARESALIGAGYFDFGEHDAAWFTRQYPDKS